MSRQSFWRFLLKNLTVTGSQWIAISTVWKRLTGWIWREESLVELVVDKTRCKMKIIGDHCRPLRPWKFSPVSWYESIWTKNSNVETTITSKWQVVISESSLNWEKRPLACHPSSTLSYLVSANSIANATWQRNPLSRMILLQLIHLSRSWPWTYQKRSLSPRWSLEGKLKGLMPQAYFLKGENWTFSDSKRIRKARCTLMSLLMPKKRDSQIVRFAHLSIKSANSSQTC